MRPASAVLVLSDLVCKLLVGFLFVPVTECVLGDSPDPTECGYIVCEHKVVGTCACDVGVDFASSPLGLKVPLSHSECEREYCVIVLGCVSLVTDFECHVDDTYPVFFDSLLEVVEVLLGKVFFTGIECSAFSSHYQEPFHAVEQVDLVDESACGVLDLPFVERFGLWYISV